MRRIVIVLLTVLLVASCGGQSAADKKAEKDKQVAAAAKKREAAREKKIGETGDLCKELVADFATALEDLNSRLAVGLKKDAYDEKLGDARVAYDKTDWDTTPNTYCVQKVGVPLESAFNEFVKANTIWEKCIDDYGCDFDKDATPKMQVRWEKAAKLIESSKTHLANFKLD